MGELSRSHCEVRDVVAVYYPAWLEIVASDPLCQVKRDAEEAFARRRNWDQTLDGVAYRCRLRG